jgi:DNA polymerase III subunit epsilon
MLLAITDTETTGTNPEQNRITDVAILLYSVEREMVIDSFSQLINETDHGTISDYIEELNGTTSDLLNEYGTVPDDGLFEKLNGMYSRADYCVAHNAQFDIGMLTKFHTRYGYEMSEYKWICTQHDIKYPRTCKYENLTYLAGYYNIINPMQHRALGDCIVVSEVLKNFKFDDIIKRNNQRHKGCGVKDEGNILATIKIDFNDMEKRDQVKSLGFKWNKQEKYWQKRVIQEDLQTLPFKVELINL